MIQYAPVNGLRFAYETFGDPEDRPLLLIMGLASQMLIWHDDFCAQLAKAGHFVVRFDNRDVGLSSRCRDLGRPSLLRATFAAHRGRPVRAAYTLDDMAGDAIGLLETLEIDRAHLMGASMGGMIAQAAAIRYPERVASLTSLMSTTGDPRLPRPTWKATRMLLRRPPRQKDAFADYSVQLWRTIGSPGYPFDETGIRQRSEQIFERGLAGSGAARQMVAIIAHGDRTPKLTELSLPALVIHGQADPLVPVAGGHATAQAIPGAELMLLDGVGHTLPREVWPGIVDSVSAMTKIADSRTG
ncbi:MAG: alpha/beta hydrolase [Acidobacteriota bacterium]